MADSRIACNSRNPNRNPNPIRATEVVASIAHSALLRTPCPSTWLKRLGMRPKQGKLLDISDTPVTNIRALSAMMNQRFGKMPHTLRVSQQAYEALQNDAEVRSYLPSFQSSPATHEQLIIILGVREIVIDGGKVADVGNFEGDDGAVQANVSLHCDVKVCTSKAAWIKRRARCIGAVFSVARGEAIEAACQDWLAFNPSALNSTVSA